MFRPRAALAGTRIVTTRRIEIHGADMRSIYLRSLLFVCGLLAFVLIESLAPRAADAVAPAPELGLVHHAA
jgi:hypothetical protein